MYSCGGWSLGSGGSVSVGVKGCGDSEQAENSRHPQERLSKMTIMPNHRFPSCHLLGSRLSLGVPQHQSNGEDSTWT